MGHFLAVSAFRDRGVDSVAGATLEYMSAHGVGCAVVQDGSRQVAVDASIFAPVDRWTVVLWPPYFNVHDVPLCARASARLETLASTVHVVDDDYWTHVLFDRGALVDRFASIPDLRADSPQEARALAEAWAGDADRVGAVVGRPAEEIRPYLVQLDPEGEELGRAFPDDEFPLEDFWVFADFWARLGISYPEDVGHPQRVLRLTPDFTERLPTGDGP